MIAPRYAEGTEVPVERSRAELEQLLRRHGATEFGFYTSNKGAVFRYRIAERLVQHTLEYPQRTRAYTHDKRNVPRKEPVVRKALESEWRRRWRAQLLITKAKLEFIASGLSTLEREFMSDLMLPNGDTVGEAVSPRLKEAYETGAMPELLPNLPRQLGSGT